MAYGEVVRLLGLVQRRVTRELVIPALHAAFSVSETAVSTVRRRSQTGLPPCSLWHCTQSYRSSTVRRRSQTGLPPCSLWHCTQSYRSSTVRRRSQTGLPPCSLWHCTQSYRSSISFRVRWSESSMVRQKTVVLRAANSQQPVGVPLARWSTANAAARCLAKG